MSLNINLKTEKKTLVWVYGKETQVVEDSEEKSTSLSQSPVVHYVGGHSTHTHTHTHTPIYTPLLLQMWNTNLVEVGDKEGIVSCF